MMLQRGEKYFLLQMKGLAESVFRCNALSSKSVALRSTNDVTENLPLNKHIQVAASHVPGPSSHS